MAGVYDHPEIDEFLDRADEVLAECPEPTTSDPFTGTPSSHRGGPAGTAQHGPKKLKRRTDKEEATLSASAVGGF